MEQSQSIGNLTKALCNVQGSLTGLKPTKENPFFHSKYVPLCDIIEASRELLATNGLAVIQANGGDEKSLKVFTQLCHISGEWIRGELVFPITKAEPQVLTAACTYMRRTGWASILGLAADEDNDGNNLTESRSTPKSNTPLDQGVKIPPKASAPASPPKSAPEVAPKESEKKGQEKEEKKSEQEAKQEFDVIVGVLSDIRRKEGTNKNNKPYTLFTLELEDGKKFSCFDKKIGETAEALKNEEVIIEWKPNGKYRDALSIAPASIANDDIPMGDNDGSDDGPF